MVIYCRGGTCPSRGMHVIVGRAGLAYGVVGDDLSVPRLPRTALLDVIRPLQKILQILQAGTCRLKIKSPYPFVCFSCLYILQCNCFNHKLKK